MFSNLFGMDNTGKDNGAAVAADNNDNIKRTYDAMVQATGNVAVHHKYADFSEKPLGWNFGISMDESKLEHQRVIKSFDCMAHKIVDKRYTSCAVMHETGQWIGREIANGNIKPETMKAIYGDDVVKASEHEVKVLMRSSGVELNDRRLEAAIAAWPLTGYVPNGAPIINANAMIGVMNEGLIELYDQYWGQVYELVARSNNRRPSGKSILVSKCNLMTYDDLNVAMSAAQTTKTKKKDTGNDIFGGIIGGTSSLFGL
ncbi:hypothetical protein HNP86_001948 [Methanococcus maripaludis]|uniref:Uncharacterized protein n=1 Tax=Methanococcus maripaludis TaxID=39152 RepID=A0A7J9NVS9_METMI|nr:hypothetical protein [Methanococcus maripaludis]MBA2851789.1 hypothetical protein [Methanococcus maripaludis]